MNKVLQWLRSNLYTVIFLVLMVVAGVSMPLVSAKLNRSVRTEVQRRVKMQGDLQKLEQTSFLAPGAPPTAQGQNVVMNQKLLDAYREAVEQQKAEADQVYETALEHNRQGRGVLMPILFPDPPPAQREVLPVQFHEVLVAAYDDLLAGIGAGTTPDPAELAEALQTKREQFITSMLAKSSESDLTGAEQAELRRFMTESRTSTYVKNARQIDVYASPAALDVPRWEQARTYTMGELFNWQWNYWIIEDLLAAVARANASAASVIDAPVKQIVAVQLADSGITGVGGVSSGAAAAPPGGSFGAGGGFGGRGGRRGPGGAAAGGGGGGGQGGAASATPIDPKVEATLDFNVSLTGRQTSALYDVRYAIVKLLVDPERLPQVLDALSAQNFITVVDMSVVSTDPYDALAQGYFFGSGALAEITLTLETVWLREWTSEFMPRAVKEALGIPVKDAAPGEDPDRA